MHTRPLAALAAALAAASAAPAASAQTLFSLQDSGGLAAGPYLGGATLYQGQTYNPATGVYLLTLGGQTYNALESFFVTSPLQAGAGSFTLYASRGALLSPALAQGTLSGVFTSTAFSGGTLTGAITITQGTGLFAGDTGTAQASYSGLPPLGTPVTQGAYNATITGSLLVPAAAVPEPSPFALLSLGLLPAGLLAARRRKA